MCCEKPCLTPSWRGSKFGYYCLNCQTFIEGA